MMKRYIEFLLIWSSGFKVPWNTFRLTLSLSLPRPSFKCLGAKVIVCCIMRWDTPLDRNSYLKNQSFLPLLKTWKKEAHNCITCVLFSHTSSLYVHWFLGQLKENRWQSPATIIIILRVTHDGMCCSILNTFEKLAWYSAKWKLK